MESWDDDNFEPPTAAKTAAANKWEGEDEDDEVKENWEDEDEERKEEAKAETVEVKKPKKKGIAERAAEKERIRREEVERRLKEQEQEQEEEISPEERLRMQKESDLKIALETTFGGHKATYNLDDISLPETKEEFETFTDTLTKKLTPLVRNAEYPSFIENLTRNLCATLSSLDIKKVKNTLDNLFLEKQKIEKGEKTKKNKGKGKAKLKLEGDNELSQLSAAYGEYDVYDDFM